MHKKQMLLAFEYKQLLSDYTKLSIMFKQIFCMDYYLEISFPCNKYKIQTDIRFIHHMRIYILKWYYIMGFGFHCKSTHSALDLASILKGNNYWTVLF